MKVWVGQVVILECDGREDIRHCWEYLIAPWLCSGVPKGALDTMHQARYSGWQFQMKDILWRMTSLVRYDLDQGAEIFLAPTTPRRYLVTDIIVGRVITTLISKMDEHRQIMHTSRMPVMKPAYSIQASSWLGRCIHLSGITLSNLLWIEGSIAS